VLVVVGTAVVVGTSDVVGASDVVGTWEVVGISESSLGETLPPTAGTEGVDARGR
jgi:hypothetical protein